MAEAAPLLFDVAELGRGLYGARASVTELDVVDPRYEAMSSLAFSRQYVEAAAHAQALWRAGAWDLRALGYLLYGHFLETGLPGLAWLLDAVTQTFGARWDEIGPGKKKRELGDNTMKWLAQALLRELMRREKLQDEVWPPSPPPSPPARRRCRCSASG
jgi:hypothetical protein